MSADLIARLRDHSWGDNITDTLSRWCRDRDEAASALEAAEARIASVRDESVEECARVAEVAEAMRVRLFEENGASINAHKAVMAYDIATAIRALRAPPAPKQEGA